MALFETERLTVRRMVEADAPFYLEMLGDPDFRSNIGDRGLRTVDDARVSMRERVFTSYETFGFGMFLVSRKSDREAIGMAGLVNRDFLDDIDLGYAFLPRGRGQGYAAEAAAACVNYGSQELGIQRLAAITGPDNAASIRLLQKLGFHYTHNVAFPNGGDTCRHFLLEF